MRESRTGPRMHGRMIGGWLLALGATPVLGLAGFESVSRESASAPSPTKDIEQFLSPSVTFVLTEEDAAQVPPSEEVTWQLHAQKIASLQQIDDCTEDLLGSTVAMVEAASEGDALAMASLGTLYLLGQECSPKRNLTWAVHWLQRAAALGQADAQATLGFLHDSDALRLVYNFTAVTFEKAKAMPLFEAAAGGGSMYAAMALASKYHLGLGVKESCPASAAYYEAAASAAIAELEPKRKKSVEQSNPIETEHATLLHRQIEPREARGVMDVSSIEYLDYLAQVGDLTGKVSMGHIYHSGTHGVKRDKVLAKHWFRSAAIAGEPTAHAALGMMLMRGKEYKAAIASLRRGAKLNDPSGWAGLGYAYLHGAGLPQSDERAAKSLWMAARSGHLDSIFNLGVLHMQGRGVAADAKTAFRHWSIAAEFQHPQAQLLVGRMALRGLEVRKDCATAQFFLKHAAEASPTLRSLLLVGLAAYDAGRPQRSLMHYLLAAHAGLEAGVHNAAFLLAEEMPKLRPAHRGPFKERAAEYFQQAAIAGSMEAQVQLANLLAEQSRNYQLANKLYTEAAQAGSRDAMWHLGYNYMHGHGVKSDMSVAWQLMRDAGMQSKHAKLGGLEKVLFGVVRSVYEARVFIMVLAMLMTAVATNGNPFGRRPDAGIGEAPEWHGDDVDDFDDFD